MSLYPNTYPLLIEQQLPQVDLYLDINHFDKIPLIYELVGQAGIAMFAFENTQGQGQTYQAVFSHEHPEEMVAAIRHYIEERRSNRKGARLIVSRFRHTVVLKRISWTLFFPLYIIC